MLRDLWGWLSCSDRYHCFGHIVVWHNNDVYVIKTPDIEKLRLFLQNFGLSFVKEQHGDGPEHYACEVSGKVLEIYPDHFLPQKEVSDGAT